MAELFAGDPTLYPADYTIPDDADPPTAAAMNVGLEALGHRTAYLKALHAAFDVPPVVYLTGTTTWTAGPHDRRVRLVGCGGGGGGGGGGAGVQGANLLSVGGGGGGAGCGATVNSGSGGGAGGYLRKLIPSPSATYAYAVGAAGAAGTAGTGGSDGGAGSSGRIHITAYFI